MAITSKRVFYKTSNSYETLNPLTPNTKNIWLALHGIGYLSRYFLRSFEELDNNENYIIAPQAPSKYYLKDDYKYVGASWLTKEDTKSEIENVMTYLDAVLENENIPSTKNLIAFGFSQGVSVVTRFLVQRKIVPSVIILYAGSIPNEIRKEDFDYLDGAQTKIKLVYGNRDHFLTADRLNAELEKAKYLFRGKAEIVKFDGGHEILPELLKKLV